jgi:hypothetical protein
MSIDTRLGIILDTDDKYNTLIGKPPAYALQVASGMTQTNDHSSHQKQAALIATKNCGWSKEVILSWCGTQRPSLVLDASNLLPYQNWRDQHQKSVKELAKEWKEQCEENNRSMKKVYEHTEETEYD